MIDLYGTGAHLSKLRDDMKVHYSIMICKWLGYGRVINFYPKRNKKDLNRPSTTDAIYYRIPNENNIELSLVEFKTFSFTWEHKLYYTSAINKVRKRLNSCGQTIESQKGLDMLNNIKDKLGSRIEFSLRLKGT